MPFVGAILGFGDDAGEDTEVEYAASGTALKRARKWGVNGLSVVETYKSNVAVTTQVRVILVKRWGASHVTS